MRHRIHPTPHLAAGRSFARWCRDHRLVGAVLLPLSLAVLLAAGCAGKEKSAQNTMKKTNPAVSDTSAYQGAAAIPDTSARLTAWQNFLKDYPESKLRPAVYSRLLALMEKKEAAQVTPFSRAQLQTEKNPSARGRLHYELYQQARAQDAAAVATAIDDLAKDQNTDGDGCNEVAWDLVERGERLDDAVRLASLGADRSADSLSKGGVLDTKGWAQFQQGKYGDAVATLQQAVALSHGQEDVQEHLAQALDKSGDAAGARDLYADLLVSREDPAMRARVEALTRQVHGSVAETFSRIDQRRQAAAHPAPDIALKDYDGKEIHLADFRGKVVLLDFWHPT